MGRTLGEAESWDSRAGRSSGGSRRICAAGPVEPRRLTGTRSEDSVADPHDEHRRCCHLLYRRLFAGFLTHSTAAAASRALPRDNGVVRVGIADHLGWGVAVSATADYEVVDRRRIELVEPDVTAAPIHYESWRLDLAATAELVANVRPRSCGQLRWHSTSSPQRCRRWWFRSRCVPGHWTSPPTSRANAVRHTRRRADAIMYRQVLSARPHGGWKVHLYDAKRVVDQAEHVLGARAEEALHGPRARLGPPWTKDHRVALAATIVSELSS